MTDAELIQTVSELLTKLSPSEVRLNTTGDPKEDTRLRKLLATAFPLETFRFVDPTEDPVGMVAQAVRRGKGRPRSAERLQPKTIALPPDVVELINRADPETVRRIVSGAIRGELGKG